MENDLALVLDALPGLVWTTLPDGRVDFLSRSWREFTGLGSEELLEKGWYAASHPEDLPELVAWWRTGLLAGEANAMEARLRRLDGEYRRFLFRFRPMVDSSGPGGQMVWIKHRY